MDGRVRRMPRLSAFGQWGPAEEAALQEQGMMGGFSTPGAVVASPLSPEDREALKREPPGQIEAMAPVGPTVEWRHGAFNPEPQEGLDYWLWLKVGCGERWVPARFSYSIWQTIHGDPLVPRIEVKLWRGPMTPPPAPTPAEVDAVLGAGRAVHDASDLEVTG